MTQDQVERFLAELAKRKVTGLAMDKVLLLTFIQWCQHDDFCRELGIQEEVAHDQG